MSTGGRIGYEIQEVRTRVLEARNVILKIRKEVLSTVERRLKEVEDKVGKMRTEKTPYESFCVIEDYTSNHVRNIDNDAGVIYATCTLGWLNGNCCPHFRMIYAYYLN